jgi:hypothetical protein
MSNPFLTVDWREPRRDRRECHDAHRSTGERPLSHVQLLDDDAVNVAFGHGIDSTVKRMRQLKRPAETGPRQKKERRVYRVWAIFDSIPPSETSPGVKLGLTEDNDNDIHLAIRDSTGATMVVESPTSPSVGAARAGGVGRAAAFDPRPACCTADSIPRYSRAAGLTCSWTASVKEK